MHLLYQPVTLAQAASLALGLASLTVSPTASAQAFDAVRLQELPPGQDLGTVGAALASGPAYPGGDGRRTQLLPLIDYQWANGWFAGVSNGVGLNFSADRASAFGLRMTADFGRKESRSPALRGLGDIDIKPEIGAFYNLAWASGVFGTSSLRFGSGNDGRGLARAAGRWRAVRGGAGLARAAHQHLTGLPAHLAACTTCGRRGRGPGAFRWPCSPPWLCC